MTGQAHRALVVEDEPEVAADLVDILKTCGCEALVATNRRDALLHLTSTSFCIVLLDLQIGSEPDSIRGRLENGKAVLEEARRSFPERSGTAHSLPIIVVSGFATETEAAVAAMRDGASDVVQKLCTAKEKADRIYAALERAGRTSHARCHEFLRAVPPPNRPEGLLLSIPADRDGQRAVITLSGRPAPITMASLMVLLQLVEAQLSGAQVNKVDMGGRDDRGFKAIAVLRNELRVAYAGDTKVLIANDQKGNYWLAGSISIGEVNAEKLRGFGNSRIAASANKIRKLLDEQAKFRGKA